MFYMILLIGLFLFFFNIINWIKIKKKINQKQTRKLSLFFEKQFFKKLTLNWFIDIQEIFHEKKKGYILLPLCCFIFAFFINHFLFKLSYLLCFIFAIIFIIFIIFIQILYYKKQKKIYFTETFPELLLIFNMGAVSGISVNEILKKAGQEIKGGLGKECDLIFRRLSIGENINTVFYDAYQRFSYPEFYMFINILMLNINQGGQLRELMHRLNQVVTNYNKMEKRKMAMTGEIRMSIWVVTLIPIIFFAFNYFMNPLSFEKMFSHETGKMIIYYCLVSNILGIFILRHMFRKAI